MNAAVAATQPPPLPPPATSSGTRPSTDPSTGPSTGPPTATPTAPTPLDVVTAPTPLDVVTAADRIAPYTLPTPLLPGPEPGAAGGPRLLLKAEHLQLGGSFKTRGAANAVLALGARRIVTGSSGNHGIALARIARRLRVPLVVVLTAAASPAKVAALHALGAETVLTEGGVEEREARALALAQESGAVLIPSSDHPLVVAGGGTVGAEVLAEAPETEALYVPTGGGGLLAGTCLAAIGHPVRVVGVEPALTPRYARSLAAGRPVRLPPSTTVADGLRGQSPGTVTYPIVRDHVDELILVDEEAIVAAAEQLRRLGVHAEPSGAVALAGALRAGRREQAVAVVSGGNTPERLAALRHPRTERDTGRDTGPPAGPDRRTDARTSAVGTPRYAAHQATDRPHGHHNNPLHPHQHPQEHTP